MFFEFLKILGVALGVVWLCLILLLYWLAQLGFMREILLGCVLPVVSFIPGFYAIAWAMHRPVRPFMIAVFGGMLIRLFFIGIAFMLLVRITQLHVASFLFSLIGFYMLCLGVELYFVNSKIRYREGIHQ
jgi:hypothetical protein